MLPEAGAGLECLSKVQGAVRLEQGTCREGPWQGGAEDWTLTLTLRWEPLAG